MSVLALPTVAGCGLVGPIMGDRSYDITVENTCSTLVEVKVYPDEFPAAYTEWDWVPATPIAVGQTASVFAGMDVSTEFLAVRQLGGPWTIAGAVEVTDVPSPVPIVIDPAKCPGAPDPFDPSALVARVPGLAGADSVEWYADLAPGSNPGDGAQLNYHLDAVLLASPEMIEALTGGLVLAEAPGPPHVDERLVARLPEGPFLRSAAVNSNLKPEGWVADFSFVPEQGVIVLILTYAPPY